MVPAGGRREPLHGGISGRDGRVDEDHERGGDGQGGSEHVHHLREGDGRDPGGVEPESPMRRVGGGGDGQRVDPGAGSGHLNPGKGDRLLY